MSYRSPSLFPVLVLALVTHSAFAQRPPSNGVRGLSSPRSGLGVRNSPIVNPAPSLTPSQVLNPRGSLSSGQVLNPSPSLRRPRTGGPTIGTQSSARPESSALPAVASGRSSYRTRRPTNGYSIATHFNELSAQLRRYQNGESWAKYLALPKDLFSDEPSEDARWQALSLLKRFEKLSRDPTYDKVTSLPAFWLAHDSLQLRVDSSSASNEPHGTAGEYVLQSVVALDERIASLATDEDWGQRLSLNELRTLIPVKSEQPASESERQSVEEILKNYQAIAKENQHSAVNQLPEFKQTLAAIEAYLSPLDARLRPNLIRSLDQLGYQLRQFKNGESWASYLAPPSQALVSDDIEDASESTTKLLNRFNRLSADPTYGKVTELVAFRPAHEALKHRSLLKRTRCIHQHPLPIEI